LKWSLNLIVSSGYSATILVICFYNLKKGIPLTHASFVWIFVCFRKFFFVFEHPWPARQVAKLLNVRKKLKANKRGAPTLERRMSAAFIYQQRVKVAGRTRYGW
jgi:hypothetical protein